MMGFFTFFFGGVVVHVVIDFILVAENRIYNVLGEFWPLYTPIPININIIEQLYKAIHKFIFFFRGVRNSALEKPDEVREL